MSEAEAIWYLPGQDRQPAGPFATADVLGRCKDGVLTGATLCWCEGMDQWRPLAEVEPFSETFAGVPVETRQDPTAAQGLDDLGRAFSKAMSLTRKKAKTVSLKVSISRHEKHRRQLLLELGEMVYRHESDVELLLEAPYAETVRQIRAEDESIESLRGQIERIEQAGFGDQEDDNR